jgi:hypothetical protein
MVYTTIGVSKNTKALLDLLKGKHMAKSYDVLINEMAKKEGGALLDGIFGIAPNIGEFKRNKDEFERF